jgi:hypothetical protein
VGEIELAEEGGSGVCAAPPKWSTWMKKAKSAVPSKQVDGLRFFESMGKRVCKPLVVILDNTAISPTKKLKPYGYLLKKNGM